MTNWDEKKLAEIERQLKQARMQDPLTSGVQLDPYRYYPPTSIGTQAVPATRVYPSSMPQEVQRSLAQVQLTNGEIVGMVITASPKIAEHFVQKMKDTGFLNLYNESESLMIRSDRIAAIKLTKLTLEE